MKTTLLILILIITVGAFSLLQTACNKADDGNRENIGQIIPDGFPQPVYTFSDHPLTNAGFELGRKLFYDGRLSIDGYHSCASCHQQIAAFGTYEHDRSHGVRESHTLRNAPVLFNLAWNKSFHWDGAYKTLAEEAAQPITGHIEMGETFEGVLHKLENNLDYKRRFRKVFHTEKIEPIHIQKALSLFTAYLTSYQSKYDRYKKGMASFTTQEETGYNLFKTHCATCHPEPLFTDFSLRNIGLPIDPALNDHGRMMLTGNRQDSLRFKVPTLRNIYASANYMHDGRFNTLAQVLNHYRSGVQQSPTLDPLLANGITLTDAEANAIAVFLRTLTDSVFLRDPKLKQP